MPDVTGDHVVTFFQGHNKKNMDPFAIANLIRHHVGKLFMGHRLGLLAC